MKKLALLIGLFFCTAATSQETLYSCGTINKTDFNGWSVMPYKAFKNISFDENNITLTKENGGYYTFETVRKLDNLVGFNKLYLQLSYEKNNSILKGVSAKFSADGNIWDNAKNDSHTGPFFVQNKSMNYSFVKLQFDLQFFDNSSFTLKSVFIQGKYTAPATIITPLLPEVENANFFKLFAFKNQINIETNSLAQQEVIIMNLRGQIIHRSFQEGSNRIELNTPDEYYIVGVIVDKAYALREKVYLSSP